MKDAEPFKAPGFVWLIHLVCPGLVTLLAAMTGQGSNGFGALPLAVFLGAAIALATSYLIALGYQGWLARLGMTLLLFAVSMMVNGAVLFAGCMLLIATNSRG